MRGTGCSQGNFLLFDPHWGTDGYDAVEWAARQPWSDGDVGMANWSYAGLSQVLTAVTRPPHLKAIAPGMAVTDPWRDVGYPGGVTNALFPSAWWAYIQNMWAYATQTAVAEGDSHCLSDIAAHEALSETNSPPADLVEYPYPEGEVGGYPAADGLIWQRTHEIDIPVFSMVDWEDEATGPRAGYYQATLSPATTYLLGTNGRHDSYISLRFRALLIRFFNRYLKGERNGFDRGPHVWLWEDAAAPGAPLSSDQQLADMTPGEVLTRQRLPVRVRQLRLWFGASGSLSSARPGPGEQADSYQYPVPGPSVNADLTDNESEWQGTVPSQAGSLAYTTAPLPRTLVFYGPASADLWVSSTSSDADVQATITEVRPDGQEEYVQRGWLRLSNRAVDPALSTALLPFHVQTKESQQLMPAGRPVLARLEIEQFSHVFRRGSSIRIWLDTPSGTGEWGFSDPSQQSTIQIWHDPVHRSSLDLGLLQIGGITTPYATCNTLVSEPCRTNPVPVPRGTGPNGSTAFRRPIPPTVCTAWQRLTIKVPRARRAAAVKSAEIYLGRRLVRRVSRSSLKRPITLDLAGYNGSRVLVTYVIRTTHRSITIVRSYPSCQIL
jgi:putative CocE/NonD family hydrolase